MQLAAALRAGRRAAARRAAGRRLRLVNVLQEGPDSSIGKDGAGEKVVRHCGPSQLISPSPRQAPCQLLARWLGAPTPKHQINRAESAESPSVILRTLTSPSVWSARTAVTAPAHRRLRANAIAVIATSTAARHPELMEAARIIARIKAGRSYPCRPVAEAASEHACRRWFRVLRAGASKIASESSSVIPHAERSITPALVDNGQE